MAGAGYKLFNTGDVLTAAQVNTYLMQQTVMVFASATARNTALSGILAEGLCCYLTDTNDFQIYDGSAWVSYGSGDITGVTAGTGLTGGGTSGSVTLSIDTATTVDKTTAQTLTNKTISGSSNTISNVSLTTGVTGTLPVANGGTNLTTYTTGDIPYASASNTLGKLAIGTSGQVLTVSGGVPVWSAPAGGGKVLQVVQGTYSTEVTSSSATFADTGLSASITPSSSSSKILVLVTQNGVWADKSNQYASSKLKLFRASTEVFATNQVNFASGVTSGTQIAIGNFHYLDSPSTTSSTTYKTQFNNEAGSTNGVAVQKNSVTSTIILMEIGA